MTAIEAMYAASIAGLLIIAISLAGSWWGYLQQKDDN